MALVVESLAESARITSGFMSVKIDMLRRVRDVNVDLFVQYQRKTAPVLYNRARLPIDDEHLKSLSEAGIEEIYVRTVDFHTFGAHVLATVESLMEIESVPQAERFAAPRFERELIGLLGDVVGSARSASLQRTAA